MVFLAEKPPPINVSVDGGSMSLNQQDARHASTYWAVMKTRLKEEGADQLLTNCKQLKMKVSDGKKHMTDVANTQQLLRIIQSIPSPKAEPFKKHLKEVQIKCSLFTNTIARGLLISIYNESFLYIF